MTPDLVCREVGGRRCVCEEEKEEGPEQGAAAGTIAQAARGKRPPREYKVLR